MLNRIAPLLWLVVGSFACLALIDIAVFRSGLYATWSQPDSTAGALVGTMLQVDRYFEPGRKNVLVIGTSKIGEGFSAPLADRAADRADLHFINGSVAGSSPRVWSYLLRALDPRADRFAAIVIMVDYDQTLIEEDAVDYALDTPYLRPLLGLRDLFNYPSSFTDPNQRARAVRAILLPMQAMHDDICAFLQSPLQRYKEVRVNRPIWLEAVSGYGGRDEALPAMDIDPATKLPTHWDVVSQAQKAELEAYFARIPRIANEQRQKENHHYMDRWIGGIAARYQETRVPVIVFSMPRGPWHGQLEAVPKLNGAIKALEDAGAVVALPGDAFVELERPEFFFDTLHMNRPGRERFSQLLAAQIAPMIR